MSTAGGSLILVGTPIGNLEDLSPRAIAVLREADVICCEDTRHTGKLLKHFEIAPKKLLSLHEHNESARSTELMELFRQNLTIAVVSDAGMPLVSDPGDRLVRTAIENGVAVTVVPGPFAGVTGLVLSGFTAERWRFEGFLPRKGAERQDRISDIASAEFPSVLYESPHRVAATLSDLRAVCGDDRQVAIARELTKMFEEVVRLPLSEAVDCEVATNPRGEFVLIIDGAEPAEKSDDHAIESAIKRLIEAGLHAHDAAKAVEVLLDVPHRQAYQASLTVKAALAGASGDKSAK